MSKKDQATARQAARPCSCGALLKEGDRVFCRRCREDQEETMREQNGFGYNARFFDPSKQTFKR